MAWRLFLCFWRGGGGETDAKAQKAQKLFALVLKNLSEIEESGLMALAEEISTQPSIDCVMWLSIIIYANLK